MGISVLPKKRSLVGTVCQIRKTLLQNPLTRIANSCKICLIKNEWLQAVEKIHIYFLWPIWDN